MKQKPSLRPTFSLTIKFFDNAYVMHLPELVVRQFSRIRVVENKSVTDNLPIGCMSFISN